MLVLSRRKDDGVTIDVGGERVRVVVVGIDKQRGEVRLGFEAPDGVRILRDELLAVEQGEVGRAARSA